MTIELRPYGMLGHADHDWLDARHHFSFASYHDPARMGWGALRVWNDDQIAAGTGFAPHGHQDMEIITYVRTGAISHRDSMGNVGRTEAGDVQVMSAGSGVQHSEMNREDEATTLFQIWIEPDQIGGAPDWGTREFPKADSGGQFVTLASGITQDHAQESSDTPAPLSIRADARVVAARAGSGATLRYMLGAGRHAYLVPAAGSITIDGHHASTGDGVAIFGETEITIDVMEDCELVLVDTK